MNHHDHTTEQQAEIITEDTDEMHLCQLLIYHDTPINETVPPRARRLAGVEEMVAVQRTLQGEVTALRRVQEELLKVEGVVVGDNILVKLVECQAYWNVASCFVCRCCARYMLRL